MRSRLRPWAVVLAAAIWFAPAAAPSALAQTASQPAAAEELEGDVAGISYFYDALNDGGGWIDHPRYGFVWQPDVDSDWRPYTVGRWVNSETLGWTWLTDEPFGWAVYHYGRWSRDADFGWFWVPGTEWAPAWVLWRFNDEAIGWAPMPPEARMERGRVFADPAFYESRAFQPRWVFASPKSFTRAGVHRYVRPLSWNRDLMSRTAARVSYDVHDKRLVHRGIPPGDIEKILRGPVPRAKIAPIDDDAVRQRQVSRETAKLDGKRDDGGLGDVQIYRPDRTRTQSIVSTNPTPRAAGKPKHRGGTEFGRLSKERRERYESDTRDVREPRETNEEYRKPQNSEEALREYNEAPDARSSARGDQGGRESDGSYRPWRDPDATSRRKTADPADSPRARPEETGERARANAPDTESDGSLPVDDSAPAPRKSKSRDAGLTPQTMPEPELVDTPAKGKSSSKRIEFYEAVPADPDAEAAGPGGAPAGTRPTDAGRDLGRGSGRGPGRIGTVTPYSPPEDYAAPAPADEPRQPAAQDRDTEPASKSKSKAKSGTGEAAKPRDASTGMSETGSNPSTRKRTGATEATTAPDAEAASDEPKPKGKRRWDQNGSSGYPSVIGPDGQPVP